ncbi:MAG: selenide, water dikinase SelD [Intrasporangium sp.]|uniref:selenide, water dikinase SelD n=1 Tax=Intrasporangium sp. TaxID=1925024 RepID=UPI00264A45C2|nr:selenide, water dikinase SelD [Intrasporangium sp.]MDN5797419.1 selenide, water dikinase SelD [Intrasporangium sp.]
MAIAQDAPIRLTQFAAGGGCACKVPAALLEQVVADLVGVPHDDLLVGLESGDDAAAVRIEGARAILSTADFFTPVVDSPYDWGRIAAANALSDIYAMGGRPIVAINLLGWPPDLIPAEYIREVLRGGLEIGQQASCPVVGGHSITAPEPLYGMAVTGIADADRLMRNDTAEPGLPISLSKPIGVGVLGNRHKATGELFAQAIESMTTLNAAASQAALAAGVRACTDVTGFGLLGHLWKLCRASGVGAVVDVAAVPVLDGARESLAAGYVPGGTRRNLEWVRPHLEFGPGVLEDDLLLLADAQTSGGLLVVGEVPGAPVVGETVAALPAESARITVR